MINDRWGKERAMPSSTDQDCGATSYSNFARILDLTCGRFVDEAANISGRGNRIAYNKFRGMVYEYFFEYGRDLAGNYNPLYGSA